MTVGQEVFPTRVFPHPIPVFFQPPNPDIKKTGIAVAFKN